MSTDPTEASAGTSRRTFLTRAALGGALLTAGTLAAPLDQLADVAGAQAVATKAAAGDGLDNVAFATFAVPLEMAAVQSYSSAFHSTAFTTEQAAELLSFQSHHQAVVDTLTALLPADGPALTADPDLMTAFTDKVASASDPKAITSTLSDLENVLSSTHLWAMQLLDDSTMAKTAAQVLAVEAQQSALLGIIAGGSIAAATPQLATTDAAVKPAGN